MAPGRLGAVGASCMPPCFPLQSLVWPCLSSGQSPITDWRGDLPDSAWPWTPPLCLALLSYSGFLIVLPLSVSCPSPAFPEQYPCRLSLLCIPFACYVGQVQPCPCFFVASLMLPRQTVCGLYSPRPGYSHVCGIPGSGPAMLRE